MCRRIFFVGNICWSPKTFDFECRRACVCVSISLWASRGRRFCFLFRVSVGVRVEQGDRCALLDCRLSSHFPQDSRSPIYILVFFFLCFARCMLKLKNVNHFVSTIRCCVRNGPRSLPMVGPLLTISCALSRPCCFRVRSLSSPWTTRLRQPPPLPLCGTRGGDRRAGGERRLRQREAFPTSATW